MSKFRYEVWEQDGDEWVRCSVAEGEPQFIAIGLRAMADLISPQPTLGDVFRDVKAWFADPLDLNPETPEPKEKPQETAEPPLKPGNLGGYQPGPRVFDPYDSFKGGVSDANEWARDA